MTRTVGTAIGILVVLVKTTMMFLNAVEMTVIFARRLTEVLIVGSIGTVAFFLEMWTTMLN